MTKVVLKELKNLALLEFIPTETIMRVLKAQVGLDYQEQSTCAECTATETAAEVEAGTEEESGDLYGPPDLLENMGVMLLIAGVLAGILILLLVFWLLCRRCECCRKLLTYIQKKLFYNTFLRYVLQSTLKLQISAFTVIFYHQIASQEHVKDPSNVQVAISWTIVGFLNFCPFLFLLILCVNKKNLDKKEVIDKIGTLYNGLRATTTSVTTYSFVFLLRRSVFVTITFYLFLHPNLQLHGMILMTLMYITYLGYANFFQTRWAKTLEITNEWFFCQIQYCFVMLNNLVDDALVREILGYVIIGMTGFLLLINLLVIIVLSVKALIRKC